MTNQGAIHISLLALLLLLIGAVIYNFFRQPILVFSLLNICQHEIHICNTENPLMYFFVFCLPDALWYMSLLLVQTFFLKEKGWLNRLLVGIAVSLPFLWEAGQYFGCVSGTFDWFDIITYCLTLIIFLLCVRKNLLLLPCKQL